MERITPVNPDPEHIPSLLRHKKMARNNQILSLIIFSLLRIKKIFYFNFQNVISFALMIKFTTTIGQLDHLNMKYLEIPKRIVDGFGTLKVRLLCTVNDSLTFQCGLMALGEGKAYISINANRMEELGVKAGDQVTVALEKDKSKYGMDMPEELEELLDQDDEGKRRFDRLTPGMQRYIIYYVAGVKSSQLRLDRAIMLIENLKRSVQGKETFRFLLGKDG